MTSRRCTTGGAPNKPLDRWTGRVIAQQIRTLEPVAAFIRLN